MCDEIVRDAGLTPSNDGPNDGGTVTLKKQDGDVTLYSVGFAKDQMVIFTTTGGLSSVTTFPKLVELAGGQLLAPGRRAQPPVAVGSASRRWQVCTTTGRHLRLA